MSWSSWRCPPMATKSGHRVWRDDTGDGARCSLAVAHRHCNGCGLVLPPGRFHCAMCVLERSEELAATREQNRTKVARYRDANRERVNAKQREARARDPESSRRKRREYRQRNREVINRKVREYAAANREEVNRKQRENYAKRRDDKREQIRDSQEKVAA